MNNNNTIVTYKSEILSRQIEVKIEAETVWLNRQQISILFDRDIKTIGKHINNAKKKSWQVLQLSQILRQLQKMVKYIK